MQRTLHRLVIVSGVTRAPGYAIADSLSCHGTIDATGTWSCRLDSQPAASASGKSGCTDSTGQNLKGSALSVDNEKRVRLVQLLILSQSAGSSTMGKLPSSRTSPTVMT